MLMVTVHELNLQECGGLSPHHHRCLPLGEPELGGRTGHRGRHGGALRSGAGHRFSGLPDVAVFQYGSSPRLMTSTLSD